MTSVGPQSESHRKMCAYQHQIRFGALRLVKPRVVYNVPLCTAQARVDGYAVSALASGNEGSSAAFEVGGRLLNIQRYAKNSAAMV